MSRTKLSSNQAGFEHASLILAVLVVAVIGFAGYRVLQRSSDTTVPVTTTTTPEPTAAVPTTIKTKAELNQAGAALNDSGTDLDTTLNSNALDSDISSML